MTQLKMRALAFTPRPHGADDSAQLNRSRSSSRHGSGTTDGLEYRSFWAAPPLAASAQGQKGQSKKLCIEHKLYSIQSFLPSPFCPCAEAAEGGAAQKLRCTSSSQTSTGSGSKTRKVNKQVRESTFLTHFRVKTQSII